MTRPRNKRSVGVIIAEIIMAVVIIYFLLGGDTWNPKMWAVFVIVAAWIIIMNVRRNAGLESESNYLKWKQHVGLLMVLALLSSLIWGDSWWPFIIGIVLGIFWIDEYRQTKAILRDISEHPRNDSLNNND